MGNRSMGFLSNDLIYSAIVVFALAFILHAIETAWSVRSGEGRNLDRSRTERVARNATGLIVLADLILLAGLITRGLSAERLPLGNMYEFSITGAFAFTTAYLVALKKFQIRWLGLFVAGGALLTLGTAITLLYVESAPLVPALKSPWLVIHVAAAIISGGIFLLANSIAAVYLILEKIERNGTRGSWAARLPSLDSLDQLTYRLIALVFPLWTFSIIAGAIWAEAAWGRYWGWDPKETWAFITWVAYAAYLHARVTAGWKGKKAAWLCLIAGSTFLFNYIYVNIWGTGKHTYSGL
ncbi:MAG: c-type cytochrome biogenesis protein CcsB [Actinobacteria bacterium]|nr:c-type cytochrome biogenesis protein CcsB [Actinomycetota bacterium]